MKMKHIHDNGGKKRIDTTQNNKSIKTRGAQLIANECYAMKKMKMKYGFVGHKRRTRHLLSTYTLYIEART